MLRLIRKLASPLRRTPLHPQWFSFVREERNLRNTCKQLNGTVLDVGSAERHPGRHLPEGTEYIALDYFETATDWYGTQPDVFGDAQQLPFIDDCIDHALLLDVMEHLPDPDRCLAELHRVVKPGGTLTIQVPFLYPLHDEPLDFHRWTRYGLRRSADKHGWNVDAENAVGHPLETAALSANIAMTQTAINWARSKNPLVLVAVLLPFAVLATNCMAWFFAALSRQDDLMPYAYRVVWTKP